MPAIDTLLLHDRVSLHLLRDSPATEPFVGIREVLRDLSAIRTGEHSKHWRVRLQVGRVLRPHRTCGRALDPGRARPPAAATATQRATPVEEPHGSATRPTSAAGSRARARPNAMPRPPRPAAYATAVTTAPQSCAHICQPSARPVNSSAFCHVLVDKTSGSNPSGHRRFAAAAQHAKRLTRRLDSVELLWYNCTHKCTDAKNRP